MAAPLIAAGVLAGAAAITSFLGAKKAAKSAKQQAALEAEQQEKLTAERIRRLGVDERVMKGQTLAGYAGGGVQAKAPGMNSDQTQFGSPLVVLAEQAREFQRERDITEETGALQVAQTLERGQGVATQYKYQGYSNAASSLSRMFGYFI